MGSILSALLYNSIAVNTDLFVLLFNSWLAFKYISKEGAPNDLIHLYSKLRNPDKLITMGPSINPSNPQWLKLITEHLNKAYGIAGVGGAASLMNE